MSSLLAFALLSLLATDSLEKEKIEKHEKLKIEQGIGDLSGYYACRGQEGSGKNYTGITVITKRNDVYVIQWNCGGSSFVGIAIRQGNTLAASWTIPGDAKGLVRGINMYRIEPGPRLVGRWATLPGKGALQSETLTFLKALDEDD